jgi:hypothetical protein
MRHNFDNVCHNLVSHAATANHAVCRGHQAERVGTVAKRLLEGKRLASLASFRPAASSSGSLKMPERGDQRPAAYSGWRPAMRNVPGSGMRPHTAGETPAAIWATLVITRALSS